MKTIRLHVDDFSNEKVKELLELGVLEEADTLVPSSPLEFSLGAQDVFNSGRRLWQYYHEQESSQANASFYDIREYFQGRNDKGRMNSKSNDENYTKLLNDLKKSMELLRLKIVPKIYDHRFLLK